MEEEEIQEVKETCIKFLRRKLKEFFQKFDKVLIGHSNKKNGEITKDS